MGFNKIELLAIFEHDSVTNALQVPNIVHESVALNEDITPMAPVTAVCAYSGPRPVYITDLVVMFTDVVVVDPAPALNTDIGWAVWAAPDWTATPTYASVKGYTAAKDLPQILTDVAPTALLAGINTPYNLFHFVGGTANTSIASQPTDKPQSPIRIPANQLWQVRLGLYAAGVLTAVTGVDAVAVFAYGARV